MITVRDVESFLYTWAPAGLAASWDNVGLLVGDPVREVKKILITLDITESVVEEAVQSGADLHRFASSGDELCLASGSDSALR